ncbi:MAG: ABC-type antimicrobial peptide transport system, ATPase component [Verrucomicrobiaceae bacterium]|nr:ABC-type antimicrobial peptide transport system, ATPase component [Verrucomicrobiaceae bacterium]
MNNEALADGTAVIELQNIEKTFQLGDQTVHALDGVNLRVMKGEYVSVMGPSGSGKSTMLNMLGLLDKPDRGNYRLAGHETTTMDEEQRARWRREQIGFVFQSFHLVPRLTAQENIELPMLLEGLAPRERHNKASDVMARLGLSDRGKHLPNQLSGGQRQRVAIARAIVMRPALLLADEPTGNLDSRSGTDVIELLEELNRTGITLVVVTHDAQLGERARRHVRMVDGRVAAE